MTDLDQLLLGRPLLEYRLRHGLGDRCCYLLCDDLGFELTAAHRWQREARPPQPRPAPVHVGGFCVSNQAQQKLCRRAWRLHTSCGPGQAETLTGTVMGSMQLEAHGHLFCLGHLHGRLCQPRQCSAVQLRSRL